MADKGTLSGGDLDQTLKDASQNKEQTPDTTDDLDLGSFNNPKEMLKSYKEIQGAFTRMTQENKTLKEKNAELESQAELGGASSFIPETSPGQEPSTTGGDFDPYDPNSFDSRVAQVASSMRISEILEEEHNTNPVEFQERYAFVKMLGAQHPHLARTGAGVKKLFEQADKLRVEAAKKSADKAMAHLFGRELTDEDKTKIRGLIGEHLPESGQTTTSNQTNAGYMPDSTGSVRTGQDVSTKPDLSKEIEEAKKAGDSLRVTELVMQQALEKE